MDELTASLIRASQHTIRGRLSRDPETKYFDAGSMVCNASMAVNRPGAKRGDGQEPDWFKVAIWGEEGQRFADTCKKGDLVEVFGRVKSESWTNRDGEKRTQLVITADEWEVIPTGGSGSQSAAPAPAARPQPAPAAGGFDDDDSLPF